MLIAPLLRLPLSLPGVGLGGGLGCAGGRPPLLSATAVLRLVDTLSAITRRSSGAMRKILFHTLTEGGRLLPVTEYIRNT